MTTTLPTSEQFSPLLDILLKQIVLWVREKGMKNVIVVAHSWSEFQQIDPPLPDGAYVTQRQLVCHVRHIRKTFNEKMAYIDFVSWRITWR